MIVQIPGFRFPVKRLAREVFERDAVTSFLDVLECHVSVSSLKQRANIRYALIGLARTLELTLVRKQAETL